MIVSMDSKFATISKVCPFCGKEDVQIVPTEGYGRWIQGELIQKAMPNVDASIREFLMTGMCPSCQEKIFGEEE